MTQKELDKLMETATVEHVEREDIADLYEVSIEGKSVGVHAESPEKALELAAEFFKQQVSPKA